MYNVDTVETNKCSKKETVKMQKETTLEKINALLSKMTDKELEIVHTNIKRILLYGA